MLTRWRKEDIYVGNGRGNSTVGSDLLSTSSRLRLGRFDMDSLQRFQLGFLVTLVPFLHIPLLLSTCDNEGILARAGLCTQCYTSC